MPNSTMTNANIDSAVASVDGKELVLKYKDGEKKFIVPANIEVVMFAPATLADLKPGEKVFVSPGKSCPTARVEAPRHHGRPQRRQSADVRSRPSASAPTSKPAAHGTALAPFGCRACKASATQQAQEVVHDASRTHRENARHQARKGLELEAHLRRDRRHVAGFDHRRGARPDEADQAAGGEGGRAVWAEQERAGAAQRGAVSRHADAADRSADLPLLRTGDGQRSGA